MIKAFLDTNVFLNIILDETHCLDCTRLLNYLKHTDMVCAVTSHLAMADTAYVVAKNVGKNRIVPILDSLREFVDCVLPVGQDEIAKADMFVGPDFEDILQFVNALSNGCNVIVTCNPKDFRKIKPKEDGFLAHFPEIYTPEEFLSKLIGD